MAAGLRGVQSDTDVIGALLERVASLEGLAAGRLAQGRVVACTSGTRPTSGLFRGLRIFESDTGETLVWYGPVTQWQMPWEQAWGAVAAAAVVTSDSAGFTAVTDIAGSAVTFTTPGARRYRAQLFGAHVTSTVGSTTERFELRITDAAGTVLSGGQVRDTIPTAAVLVPAPLSGIGEAPPVGSVTYKVRGLRDSGTGTMTVKAGSITTAFVVEDIGPAGPAPAT